MARRFFRKMAWLSRVEATYGTDSAPTGAANAIQASDVTLSPLEGEEVQRDLIMPYFGDQGSEIAGEYARIQGSVELSGSGTAGTPPAYAPLLRACGLAQIVSAGASVEYKPVSSAQEAASIYMILDGVRHILVGTRGTTTFSVASKQVPKLQFTLQGLLGPITDQPMPVPTYTGYVRGLVANKGNTTFSLHGLAATTAALESLTFDLGNDVQPRMLIGSEGIEIVGRRTSGSAVVEAQPIATKNWYAIALASTRGPLALRHGSVAGNIVELDAAGVQIGRPTYGNSQGILTNTLPLTFSPTSGDDEFTLRLR